MLYLARLTIALVCLVYSAAGFSAVKVVFGNIHFPPNTVIDPDTGECTGRNILNVEMILAHYDIEISVICTNPARLYKLVETGDVDFTLNPKSTRALKEFVDFVEPAYHDLVLNLYSHDVATKSKTVAAIRGFDYHGFRRKLMSKGLRFIDLPSTSDAVKLFHRGRTGYLISYQKPYIDFVEQQGDIPVLEEHLITFGTYFAVSKKSKHRELLKASLNDYALKYDLEFFFAGP